MKRLVGIEAKCAFWTQALIAFRAKRKHLTSSGGKELN
jgi:hypothetical protein